MSDDTSPAPSAPPAYAHHWIKLTADNVDTWRVPGLHLAHREIGYVHGDAILSAHIPDSDYRAARHAPAVVARRGEMLAGAVEWMIEDNVLLVYHLYGSGDAKYREYCAMIERWSGDYTGDMDAEWAANEALEDGPDEVEHVAIVLEVYALPEGMRPQSAATAAEEEE